MDSKGTMINRLQRAGLRAAAEAYMDEVRCRLKAAGTKRATAVQTAWQEMWKRFSPAVEEFEQMAPAKESLITYAGNVDDLLDPDYAETNPQKEMRDSMFWLAREFRRVVTETPDGTAIHWHKARKPPPTTMAILIAECYASKPPGKRDSLVSKLLAFAERDLTPEETETTEYEEDGFLAEFVGDD